MKLFIFKFVLDMAEPVANKQKLLIVDDDKFIVMLFSKMFGNLYDIQTANDGKVALELIKSGYSPGVILSDNIMIEMNGDEFLLECSKIIPSAIRIIVTGNSETREIIELMSKSKAFMFLTKPTEQVVLVQAIRIAFQKYQSEQESRKNQSILIKQVKELTAENERLNKKLDSAPNQKSGFTKFLNNYINTAEFFYLTPHTQSVINICQEMAKNLKIPIFNKANLIYAAIVANYPILTLPEKYCNKYINKENSDDLNKLIIDHSRLIYDMLRPINDFDDVLKILQKHLNYFEVKLTSNDEIKDTEKHLEAQILALASFYHYSVFSITDEELQNLMEFGSINVMKEDVIEKYNKTLALINENPFGYEKEVVTGFLDCIKFETLPIVMLPETDFSVIYNPIERNKKAEEDFGTKEIVIKQQNVLKVKAHDLQVNMILGQDIKTIKGNIYAQKGMRLDLKILSKLRQLESTGLIDGNENIVIIKRDNKSN
jgi:response regulator RpfG family c-di-GMP phosphodiesterase